MLPDHGDSGTFHGMNFPVVVASGVVCRMKTILNLFGCDHCPVHLILLVSALLSTFTHAGSTSVLEQAIMQLPSSAVADISFKERRVFLKDLREDTPKNKRLDIKNGYLEFYSDGETPFHASSMLYMKALRRKDGGWIVFCHMPKPQADGKPARLGQTFVFTQKNHRWTDVTINAIPKEVDIKWYFKPRRTTDLIEAGSFANLIVQPGGGHHYLHELDLVWDGIAFRFQKASSQQFLYDSL